MPKTIKANFNIAKSQDWHDFYADQHSRIYKKYHNAENLIKSKYHREVYDKQFVSNKIIPYEKKKKIFSRIFHSVLGTK